MFVVAKAPTYVPFKEATFNCVELQTADDLYNTDHQSLLKPVPQKRNEKKECVVIVCLCCS